MALYVKGGNPPIIRGTANELRNLSDLLSDATSVGHGFREEDVLIELVDERGKVVLPPRQKAKEAGR